MARLALLLGLLAPAAPSADVAVRDDGKRLEGELSLTKAGKLAFTPREGDADPRKIIEYRFAADPPPFRVAGGMLLTLAGGQQLTGVLLGVGKDKVAFRTAWAERLEVPRDHVTSLTHLPGWRPVFHDDLARKLTAWKVQGEPKTAPALLDGPGQSLTLDLARAVAEGRVAVNFRELDATRGARWTVDAVFARKQADRTVRVTLAGAGDSLSVDAGGLKGAAREVARSNTYRRLFLDFSAGSLRVSVDDAALWHTFDEGPGGALKQVRLACADLDRPAKAAGGVAFSQFALDRAVPESRHPPGDTRQDELWLAEGDQLFGSLTAADPPGVELKGRFGVKRYGWAELRGWFPRQGRKGTAAKEPVVRAGLRGGLRAKEDAIEATLVSLDARQVKLTHPVLGDLALPRERVAWLRPIVK